MNAKSPQPYRAPAIARAAAILDALAERDVAPTLSDLSRELGLGKSTLHGLLHTLEELGWVGRDEGGGFRVGRGVLALARRAFGTEEMSQLAHPYLEALAESLGQSVCVGRFRAGQVRIADCVIGGGDLNISLRPGQGVPLLAAATGKVFLAGMEPDGAREFLRGRALVSFTERTITDPEQFLEEIARCRARGYATDDEEYLRGVRAIAAPITEEGRTVGALWAVGFVSSFSDPLMAQGVKRLAAAARAISDHLSPLEREAAP